MLIAFLFSCSILKGQSFVAQIGKYKIDSTEFAFFFSKYRSKCILKLKENKFSEQHKTKDSIAADQYKTMLETIKPFIEVDKNREALLLDYKCWPFENHAQFLEELKKENEARARKLKNNEMFFGPTSFNEFDFYDYYISNAIIHLNHLLEEKKFLSDFLKREQLITRIHKNELETLINLALAKRSKHFILKYNK